jgi:pyrroloquinoline quinone biosynthesis protein D
MMAGPDSRLLTLDSVPSLWRLARLDYDTVRKRPILLYPEGTVLLNDTGAAILELCNGRHSVAEIVSTLSERYQADVSSDVVDYLDQMAQRELIRVR